jgi:hypothetical protein
VSSPILNLIIKEPFLKKLASKVKFALIEIHSFDLAQTKPASP